MNRDRVIILARGKMRDSPLYRAWSEGLACSCSYETEYDLSWSPPADVGLVVTAQQYEEPEVTILSRCMDRGQACLVLADGIVEYRNTWENPGTRPAAIFQPAFAHKIAVLGRAQARTLEAWGNVGKCELVGSPRLDALRGAQPRNRSKSEPFRILVVTARTPGFTEKQLLKTRTSLRDLKNWFERNPELDGTALEPVWRLTGGMDREIGVSNRLGDVQGGELAEQLGTVDATITMPSTCMLEAMLCGMPVALLDYHNRPHYVPAAWRITAPEHLDSVVPALLAPAPARMLFQDMVLHDALECRAPAVPRMLRLVEAMLRVANACAAEHRPLVFPPRLLPDPQNGHHAPEPGFDLRALYPEHPVFSDLDRARLQVEVGHLSYELQQRDAELQRLKSALQATGASRAVPGPLRRFWNAMPGPRKFARLVRERREREAAR